MTNCSRFLVMTMAYLVGNCGGADLPFLPTARGGQASPASPSATGDVDSGVVLDGGAAWARGAVQEEVGCGAAALKKASGAVFLKS